MNIGIVGMGLIGGSFCKALSKFTSHKVYGKNRSQAVMEKAEKEGSIVGRISDDNIGDMDLIIVALSPAAAREEMEKVCGKLKDGTLVIDIVGNKTSMVEKMNELAKKYPKLEFISTHPMAGKECSGYDNATDTMFVGASALLVPVHASATTVAALTELFKSMGFSIVKVTTADEHDRIIAYTSQLAHVISSCYVNTPLAEKQVGFSAGSFKDLSRVAKMNVDMWTELFLENSAYLCEVLDDLIVRLSKMSETIKSGDKEKLASILQQGNDMKIKVDALKNVDGKK